MIHPGIARTILFFILSLVLFSACSTGTPAPTPAPQLIDIYATGAAQPWLAELYDCAAGESVVLRVSDPQSAQIVLWVGQPADLTAPAYQIDSEDILIATNRESPVQNLSADEARKLFAEGQGGAQVWVFAPGEDVQRIFDREVMQGSPVTSLARLATSPQQMADNLNAEKDAVGILPRHWKAGTVREVYSIPDVPVLAIVNGQPVGAVKSLLTCLQK